MVILGVTSTSVKLWLGTLFPTLMKPEHARVELTSKDGKVIKRSFKKSDWKKPFRDINKRFYTLVEIEGLEVNVHYSVTFLRRIEKIEGVSRNQQWQEVRHGQFKTLPNSLPKSNEKPFTVGIGSCFYSHRDGGRAAAAYKALYDREEEPTRPDISFLTGDQVYLDIGFDSLSLVKSEIRERIADDYAKHWQLLGSIFTRGGTWMLPDDHEYWNDYPFYDSLLPTLLALKLDYVRKTWERTAMDGVKRVQHCSPLEIFDIGIDLTFCIADVRSNRSKNGFMADKDFKGLTKWAAGLKSPGVLVISQPLIVEKNKSERNLLSFRTQYSDLLEAMGKSGHDIVVLSGDVHFGRIATAALGPNGGRLIEIISSPLSNLTGLNGVATATPKYTPEKFPDPNVLSIPGWAPAEVLHDKSFSVSTKKGSLAYPKERTREHFMTVGFQRAAQKEIKLTVNAWQVRERDDNNLPVRDFQPYTVTLK